MSNATDSPAKLHATVQVVGGLLSRRVAKRRSLRKEANLRYELVACLLGSQVSHEAAEEATCRVADAGLLADDRWECQDASFETDIAAVLANRHAMAPKGASYRFPNVKARQLSMIRLQLQSQPLLMRLFASSSAMSVRAGLVRDLPGIGPKQASMFMRNVGRSYDVAILDVHVLNFFHRLGLLPDRTAVSNLKRYEGVEVIARDYAHRCGQSVGTLDWAIWITMRAAKELQKCG